MTEPTLTYIAYDEFLGDLEAVARAIDAESFRPDFLVGIGRGGLVPASYLSHRTGIPMLSVDHSSRVAGFADELLVKLAAKTAAGRRMLFIDDINDSGSTIVYLRRTLEAEGADPANVRFAVLINNVSSQAQVEYWSRSIDRRETKDWFVFPWEAVSSRSTLVDEAHEVPSRIA